MKNLFKERLFFLRSRNKITQKQLGDAIHVSMQTINDMEKGRTSTTLERAIELAEFFHVSLDYLVGHSDIPKSPSNIFPDLGLSDTLSKLIFHYSQLSEQDSVLVENLVDSLYEKVEIARAAQIAGAQTVQMSNDIDRDLNDEELQRIADKAMAKGESAII